MTRDEKYLTVIALLVNYVHEISNMVSMTPNTRKQVEQILTKVNKTAKEI